MKLFKLFFLALFFGLMLLLSLKKCCSLGFDLFKWMQNTNFYPVKEACAFFYCTNLNGALKV